MLFRCNAIAHLDYSTVYKKLVYALGNQKIHVNLFIVLFALLLLFGAEPAKCLSMLISLVAQTVKNLPAMQETWIWSLVRKIPWRREWQSTPVLLPGEFHGQRSLVGYSPWGPKNQTCLSSSLSLHFSCLYIFWMYMSYWVYNWQICYLILSYLFAFLIECFEEYMFLIFYGVQFIWASQGALVVKNLPPSWSVFSFIACVVGFNPRNHCLTTRSWGFLFSSKSFIVLALTFSSLIHFELIFIYNIRKWPQIIF